MDVSAIIHDVKERLKELKEEKFTGKLLFKFYINEGGIRDIAVSKEEKLSRKAGN